MKPIYKALILLETVICFGPLVLILGLGLIVIPVAIIKAFEGEFGGLFLLAIELGGALGLVALICVLLHIFNPTKGYISAKKLRLFIAAGFVSLFAYIYMTGLNSWSSFYLFAPLAASFHFIYLGRSYVFHNS